MYQSVFIYHYYLQKEGENIIIYYEDDDYDDFSKENVNKLQGKMSQLLRNFLLAS